MADMGKLLICLERRLMAVEKALKINPEASDMVHPHSVTTIKKTGRPRKKVKE